MIAQLIFGLLVACSLFAQTQVELKKQVKGELPPDKGGTGVSSCLENEGLIWQSGEFACSALASGPHAPTHQDGGTDEVATSAPAGNAIPKAGSTGTLAEGWIPSSISRDSDTPALGDISGSLAGGYAINSDTVQSDELDETDNFSLSGTVKTKLLNGVYYSSEHDWSANPGGNLAASVSATVSLAPCPAGVDGTIANHYLFIDDTSNPLDESVEITGGTCTSNATSGTIQFTPANTHTNGNWTLDSATGGIQEAINALPRTPNGQPNGGYVILPAGEITVRETVSIGDGSINGESNIHFIHVLGQGRGVNNGIAEAATQVRWQGPDGGTIFYIRGPIFGVEIGQLRLHGDAFAVGSGDASVNLRIASAGQSWFHDTTVRLTIHGRAATDCSSMA